MQVILIGMMGAGKNSVGKVLAKKLRWKFRDSDALIEKKQKMSISEIFAKKGEKKFREIEKNVIRKLCRKNKTVIAVGGGAPCFQENWSSFRKNGFVVYLAAQAETLFQRLKKDLKKNQRPLLGGQPIFPRIRSLLKKRKRFYKKADCTIRTDSLSVKEVAKSIVKFLNAQNPS